MAGYAHVVVAVEDGCGVVTLNHPKVNSLSMGLVTDLRAAVQDLQADGAVRCVIVTGGEGKFFSAGADVPTIQGTLDAPLAEGSLLAEGLKTMDTVEQCTKPVIAAVNGMALGGGCELALACHLRVAADTAVFGQPEIKLGIIPGWGGTYRLPRRIGFGRAAEWLLTGRTVKAAEALEAGLLTQVVPAAELGAAAKALAAQLAALPAAAMAATLDCLRTHALEPAQAAATEAAGFERACASQDAREGIAAFLEKRPPQFTGN